MVVKVNTDPRPDEIEEVWLGDDGPYEFVTPKVAPLIAAMRKMRTMSEEEAGYSSLDAQDRWMKKGFGPDQWARIQKRLDDEDDPLDFDHIMQVFEAIFETVTGRPPTSLGGSSPTSPRDHLEARRKQAV